MTTLNNADYYRRREQQELDLAAAALDPEIRTIHRDLAVRYAALATEATPRENSRSALR